MLGKEEEMVHPLSFKRSAEGDKKRASLKIGKKKEEGSELIPLRRLWRGREGRSSLRSGKGEMIPIYGGARRKKGKGRLEVQAGEGKFKHIGVGSDGRKGERRSVPQGRGGKKGEPKQKETGQPVLSNLHKG